MSLPKPPTSLDDSCSVIYESILYSFTPEAFLSLPLEEGAKWKKLEMGEKVSGAVCVGATPDDTAQAGLFVVGGTSGSDVYTGLQKYTYSTGKWTTITPSELITKDRLWHGSTYIKASDAILIYAGSRDGVAASSGETFTIQASEPYSVNSYGPGSSPGVKPILLNWSDVDACLVGGNTRNITIALFNPTTGWRGSGATLAKPLPEDSSSVQAIVMPGDDGSKSLYTFDLSQSPNQVRRFVLRDAYGAPLSNSAAVGNEKRELSLDDSPEYNSTLAPTATRQNFAIAQGADGKVVFSGGNSEDPLVIFDATENSWVDASEVFDAENQKVLSDSKLTSSTFSTVKTASSAKSTKSTYTQTRPLTSNLEISSTSATSTILSTGSSTASLTMSEANLSATASAAAGNSDDDSGISSNIILGITLGSIPGFLALRGLLLLLLARRRNAKRNGMEASSTRHFGNGSRQLLSRSQTRGHNATLSQKSYSSMATLIDRTGKLTNDTTRSSGSSLHKQIKATITGSRPILQEMPYPALQGYDTRGVGFDVTVAEHRPRTGPMEAQDDMRRSSGWNRYWSGGSALQILGFGGSKRTTAGSEQSSRYSEATHHRSARATQDLSTLPSPIFDFCLEINRVNSGSPVVAACSNSMQGWSSRQA
ncbi:Kelch-type beta propeller [Fusarium oxysporum f. sp. vasinfectum]|nr:Kelch-type beta propeller [Fusarium oxysporum f. sp. vasinfectum]KAK2922707.1 Kelch-type beta propeller [Fusarium oxysporum f. sp. vasinfectum]